MTPIGITGGIGMGKTACSDWLIGQGLPVLDTDVVARELTRNDSEVLAEIHAAFGSSVFDEPYRLNRERLGSVVFADDSRRRVLEEILHPRIRKRWMDTLETWEQSEVEVGFVVIPLLYETKAEDSFEFVVCVACSVATQYCRLKARGWAEEGITARNNAQMPVREKMGRADFVIWTEGNMSSTLEQMKMVLRHVAGKGYC